MSLLFRFRPLVINPELAERIGLNEAIILQQLKYWLNETDSGVDHDGKRWVYNTLDQWQKQFPFWSVDTVKRALASLHKQGLVHVEKLAKAKHDHTNYYTINYDSPLFEEGKLHSSEEGKMPSSSGATCPVLHTEITTETTAENIVEKAFGLFWSSTTKNGSKKKAASLFASLCKRDKLEPMALAALLIEDTAKRLKAKQYGFDKLHITTYLSQERWGDTLPEQGSQQSRHHGLDQIDYGSGQSETVTIGGL